MATLLGVSSPSFSNSIIPCKLQGTKVFLTKQTLAVPTVKRGTSFVVRCSKFELHRQEFPTNFKFGASSSAFQIESLPDEGGRGESTIDHMLEGLPGAKSLFKYNEDVLCLKNMNMDVYRMSIAWPRLFPTGVVSEETVNHEGVAYYKRLFSLLKYNGIEPFVTLFHFDMPKALLTKYNGALSAAFVDDFNAYAEFCFKTFGDQIKNWTTMNEPHIWSTILYKEGMTTYDERTYPYLIAHNLLKAHATAVKTYRKKYQSTQKGRIGIALNMKWFLPHDENSRADHAAVRRAMEFNFGWFLEPLVSGDYPFSMKLLAKERLPVITPQDQELIQKSFDFITVNYYTSAYVKGLPISPNDVSTGFYFDQYLVTLDNSITGETLGPVAGGNSTMQVFPRGLYEVLKILKEEYGNPVSYISENGYPEKRDDDNINMEDALQDDIRIRFLRDHLRVILDAINAGVNVNGYFIWNLMDCMDFGETSYNVRFGLNYTDFQNDYDRVPKKSANWLKSILTQSPPPILRPPFHTSGSIDHVPSKTTEEERITGNGVLSVPS